MAEALVTPDLLIWARERADYTLDMLSDKLHTKVEKLRAWESGELKPTFKQAQDLAKRLHIPFGYLFLVHPPKEELPLPDLRTLNNQEPEKISPNFRELLNEIKAKQAWYREYAIENEEDPFVYLKKFTTHHSIKEVALSIGHALGVTPREREKCNKRADYLKLLTEKIEALGVLVMRNSIVGSNTHRQLKVEEFRGFVIADKYAPLIFLNSSDANNAKIFTLIHELAHLWIDQSGISSVELEEIHHNQIEQFCNAVSAEVLVPQKEFLNLWSKFEYFEENIVVTANHFKVSNFVIARRALDSGLIEKETFFDYYKRESKHFEQHRKHERATSRGGGNYYDTARTRLGNRFAEAVIISTLEGRTLYRDAGELLNVNPSKLINFAKNMKVIK
jgi:Zn-dependent peptidase ImmA (M78 family)/DNA-binding XRE family transcriptional regulator